MSSEGESNANVDGGPIKTKRRRLHGACDLCRQKKIRCDSSKRPGNKCSNCIAFASECTHVHVNQKIGLGYRSSRHGLADSAPIADLRRSMDPLLKTILSPTYQAPTNPAVIRETLVNLARYSRALEGVISANTLSPSTVVQLPPPTTTTGSPCSIPATTTATASSSSRHASPDSSTSSPRPPVSLVQSAGNAANNYASRMGSRPQEPQRPVSCEELNTLAQNFKRSIVLTSADERFFGPSSSVAILDTAIEMGERDPQMRPPPTTGVTQYMRPEFWTVHPWEQAPPPNDQPYEFPPEDLLKDLVDLFFAHINTCIPLLHRPTFERALASGLHLTDPRFGATVLGVCATASRFSDDKRVLLEGTDSLHSCGFAYYKQLKIFHESSLRAPNLYDLQTFVLAIVYLQGSSTPEKCWFLCGFGLRAAFDIGLNRRRKGDEPPTIEDELRKRVFWALVLAEAAISTTAGRPPCITLLDFDCELPVDCDEEYWENEDPEKAFKQPPGQPSKASFYRCLLKLIEIHCAAQHAFYSVRHPEVPPGVTTEEWDRSTLANLDSALNSWVDSVPDHLRWDPYQENNIFLDQSAMLFTTYYYVQILVHRPFIASPGQPALAFSSLAICTNAARACSSIMVTQTKKGFMSTPHIGLALFVSGLILLLSIWRGRRSGFRLMDEGNELKAVFGIINVLKTYETRWHLAGRFCDLLMALSSVGGLRLEKCPPVPTTAATKRSRKILEEEESHSGLHQRSKEKIQGSATGLRESPDNPDFPIRPLPTAMAGYHRRLRRGQGGVGAAGRDEGSGMPVSAPESGGTTSNLSLLDSDASVLQQESRGSFTFPMYSSELSTPFFPFNSQEDATPPSGIGNDLAPLHQQMADSEFQALFGMRSHASTGFGANGGGETGGGGVGYGSGDGVDFQQMLSIFGGQSQPMHPAQSSGRTGVQASRNPVAGHSPGGIDNALGGDLDVSANRDSVSTQSSSTTPYTHDPHSNDLFLDLQGAAMWSGVPSGADWQDWNTYLSNVESLNSVQRFSSVVATTPTTVSGPGGPADWAPSADSGRGTSVGMPGGITLSARQQALLYLQQHDQPEGPTSEAQQQQLDRLRYGW